MTSTLTGIQLYRFQLFRC